MALHTYTINIGPVWLPSTLHRPPVAIFIAQARQRQGCLHGTVKCVTFSFPQARHAAGIIIGTKDSSSLEDDESDVSSEACERACFLDRLDVSGMSSGVVDGPRPKDQAGCEFLKSELKLGQGFVGKRITRQLTCRKIEQIVKVFFLVWLRGNGEDSKEDGQRPVG
jgi:hypothetical protein